MTSITTSQAQLDREEEGEITLELVAVRYVGSRSMFDVVNHLEPEGWPKSTPLNGGANTGDVGPWYFALMPDDGLGYIENRDDLEIVYGDQREKFAELLLEQRRLPSNVFGRGADRNLQERVFDTLGLEPAAQAGPFVDQLRDIAGIDADEADYEDDTEDQDLVETLVDTYSRGELGDAAKALRSDAEDFNLKENAGKRDRAEYIAGFDKDERAAALPEQDGDD